MAGGSEISQLTSADPSPSNYNAVDTASAVAIALMTFGTMYPMSVYSGKVLLQVRTSQPSRVRLLPEIHTCLF